MRGMVEWPNSANNTSPDIRYMCRSASRIVILLNYTPPSTMAAAMSSLHRDVLESIICDPTSPDPPNFRPDPIRPADPSKTLTHPTRPTYAWNGGMT